MKKLGIGVIGLGSIFHRVMTDMPNAYNCELVAVAARDGARAKAEAARYGVRHAFGSYEELAACPDVDLVYVATPHSMHYEHAMLCLRNGKHVICEKAFAKNDAEAREMAEYARGRGLFLMEAMWTRFLPAIRKLKEMLDSGEFGSIRHIAADFSYASKYDPASRIYAPELCGGALLDVGIYPLSVCAMLMGSKAEKCDTVCIKARSGVDARTCMQLVYPGGATAQLMSGVDVNGTSGMTILTEKARIDVPDFWHATRLVINGGTMEFPPENEGHHHQFVHAAEMIAAGKTESPVMPLVETVYLMELMTTARHENGIFYPGE